MLNDKRINNILELEQTVISPSTLHHHYRTPDDVTLDNVQIKFAF